MSFTFTIVKKDKERVICPVKEETGDAYVNHTIDCQSFFDQFQEGVIIEVSEPGHILKNELIESKRLLELAKNKLCSPGRYDLFAEEIEKFLQK